MGCWVHISRPVTEVATEEGASTEQLKWGLGYKLYKVNTHETVDLSGWFVGQNAADSPGLDYENCSKACARYTATIQAWGFKGSLQCNAEALDVMSSVADFDACMLPWPACPLSLTLYQTRATSQSLRTLAWTLAPPLRTC
mmetsp:Transcript_40531/g.114809  ORF Transcript_40531/g.114809 Transcript_40531/m.114809 type:complete len:141 (+) Transcript_40531:204-626(+)